MTAAVRAEIDDLAAWLGREVTGARARPVVRHLRRLIARWDGITSNLHALNCR
jgi:hypothetical protein